MAGAGPQRMLRIEFKNQPYDWFNLDEMGDVVKSEDFANTLRENIVHYFNVPYDYQAIFDDDGLLNAAVDFARSLQRAQPYFRVFDARNMPADLRDQALQKLAHMAAEVASAQRMLSSHGGAPGGGGGLQQPPVSDAWPQSPGREAPPRPGPAQLGGGGSATPPPPAPCSFGGAAAGLGLGGSLGSDRGGAAAGPAYGLQGGGGNGGGAGLGSGAGPGSAPQQGARLAPQAQVPRTLPGGVRSSTPPPAATLSGTAPSATSPRTFGPGGSSLSAATDYPSLAPRPGAAPLGGRRLDPLAGLSGPSGAGGLRSANAEPRTGPPDFAGGGCGGPGGGGLDRGPGGGCGGLDRGPCGGMDRGPGGGGLDRGPGGGGPDRGPGGGSGGPQPRPAVGSLDLRGVGGGPGGRDFRGGGAPPEYLGGGGCGSGTGAGSGASSRGGLGGACDSASGGYPSIGGGGATGSDYRGGGGGLADPRGAPNGLDFRGGLDFRAAGGGAGLPGYSREGGGGGAAAACGSSFEPGGGFEPMGYSGVSENGAGGPAPANGQVGSARCGDQGGGGAASSYGAVPSRMGQPAPCEAQTSVGQPRWRQDTQPVYEPVAQPPSWRQEAPAQYEPAGTAPPWRQDPGYVLPAPGPPQMPCAAPGPPGAPAMGWRQEPTATAGSGGRPEAPGAPLIDMGCFEVFLAKTEGANRFGFANVPSPNGRSLLVTWVDPSGLLGAWNRAYPDRTVREGDVILSVNGVADDVEAMRAELQLDSIGILVQPVADGSSGGPRLTRA